MDNVKKDQLLPAGELPEGFVYPPQFVLFAGWGRLDIAPWWVLADEGLSGFQAIVLARFPQRRLVAFARRTDSSNFAAFDVENKGAVVVLDVDGDGVNLAAYAELEDWVTAVVQDAARARARYR